MDQSDRDLREQVELHFGKAISIASDCDQLVDNIFKTVGIRISSQTIRRYWHIIEQNSKTSRSTKNSLSQYIGYEDFEDFTQRFNQSTSRKTTINLDSLIDVIKKTPSTLSFNFWHETFANVLKELIFHDKIMFEYFVAKLNTNASAMNFMIEIHQCYHLLHNGWYLNGIKIFCLNSPIYHHHFYYYTLEGCHHVFQQNTHSLVKTVAQLSHMIDVLRQQHGMVFPLEGAYYGLKLALAYNQRKYPEKERLIIEVSQIIENHKDVYFHAIENDMSCNVMIAVLVEILIWNGMYEDAYFFVTKYELNNLENETIFKDSAATINALYVAMTLFQNGNIKKAQKLFSNLNIDDIRFERKVITQACYQLLSYGFTPKTSRKKRQSCEAAITEQCDNNGFISLKNQMAIY